MSAGAKRLLKGDAAQGGEGDVLLAEVARGAAVCLIGRGVGALCVLDARDPGEVLDGLASALARSGEVAAKLVASEAPEAVAAVRRRLARQGVPLLAEHVAKHGSIEVVLHCGSGRVRFAEGGEAATSRRRRVLIVDDSRSMREALARILGADPELEVVGQAASAEDALPLFKTLAPDVITLDVQMPGMGGLGFLERHGASLDVPVVMVSAIRREEGETALRALELGAVDYVEKPTAANLMEAAEVLRGSVKAASTARRRRNALAAAPVAGELAGQLLAIGASTGGPEALRELLTRLPPRIPPTLIVQHIPAMFSEALARRLDGLCPFAVREARSGDRLARDLVLVAPGGRHMRLVREGGGALAVRLDDGPKESGHRPSVDAFFESVAAELGRQAVGVLLTGMGADGAKGLLKMRTAGSRTIAQDEATCVVYGMPRAAVALGAAGEVLPLDQIAGALVKRR